jgi:hypothetical protein
MRLTHQGFSRTRRRPRQAAIGGAWPATVSAPETAIYSGFSRQDTTSIFP